MYPGRYSWCFRNPAGWYGESPIFIGFHMKRVMQDFFHQEYGMWLGLNKAIFLPNRTPRKKQWISLNGLLIVWLIVLIGVLMNWFVDGFIDRLVYWLIDCFIDCLNTSKNHGQYGDSQEKSPSKFNNLDHFHVLCAILLGDLLGSEGVLIQGIFL